MKLFLDDVREPKECVSYMHKRIGNLNPIYLDNWVIVRTYKDFTNFIDSNKGKITHVSFDHDLADCFQLKEQEDPDMWFDSEGNREYTGLDCAKYLKQVYEKDNIDLPIIFVHSMNPIGTQNIINLFK